MVSVIIWLIMPLPRLPEMATASSTDGKAKNTSIVRMIIVLARPPTKPASTPNDPR